MILRVAMDCSSMSSDNGEIYYSNSERSKILKLSQPNNNLHNMSSALTNFAHHDSDNNSSQIHFNNPQAHSSPIERKKSKRFVESRSNEPVGVNSNFNITECSRIPHEAINSLNTKQSPIVRCTENTSNNAEPNDYAVASLNSQPDGALNSNANQSENVGIQLRASHQVDSMENPIEDNQTFNPQAKVASDNLRLTYDVDTNEHTQYDDTFFNKTDSSDIFQMELKLKMFPKYVTPLFDSLKLDFLQLMSNRTAAVAGPDKQIARGSKTVNDIIKNIMNILKLNTNSGVETESKKNICSTITFLTVDFNALNVLNHKLEGVYRRIESIGLTSNDKTKKINEKSTINLDAQHHNIMEHSQSNSFPTNFESLEPIGNGNDNDVSLTENKAFDSSLRIRELQKSISLSPPIIENSTVSNQVINTPSQERSLENCSLNNSVDLRNKEITVPDIINLHDTEFLSGAMQTSANKSCSINAQVEMHNGTEEEKNEKQYLLRKCPKSTEHFAAPLNSTAVKRKSSRVKTKYNDDVFVCRGTGKNKMVLQYKVHSAFKANSSELTKKICPKSINCENDNKHNATYVDISNSIPKQNDKPCRCGIFPSQIPLSWNNTLHKSIHQNLHKLQFKSQTATNVVCKINDNGFLYDIMNITTNSNNDKDLALTLKNINEFINIELNCSKKNIKNVNRSIFMAVNPNTEIIGYLETESLKNACIFQNNELSKNLIAVKFGVSKLWVMVKYRNNGVASNLLRQFCYGKNISVNDIAFAYRGGQGISFIKKYFKNNSVLIY